MKTRPAKKPTTVFLNPQQHATLQRLALRLDRSMGALVREGVELVLEKYNAKKGGKQ